MLSVNQGVEGGDTGGPLFSPAFMVFQALVSLFMWSPPAVSVQVTGRSALPAHR
jgi:hypothetical protein